MRLILPHARPVEAGVRSEPPAMSNRLLHLGLGVLSALVGVAAGHLVAALTEPAASPVLAVGSTVIDLTPTPLKEWAVRELGTRDKPVLVGSVMIGVLVLAGVAGLLARRRFAYGAVLLVALTAIPAVLASSVWPSVVTGIVGVATLWLLPRSARPAGAGTDSGPSRRAVLITAGSVAVAGVAMGTAGRWITSYRTRPVSVSLPAAADPAT